MCRSGLSCPRAPSSSLHGPPESCTRPRNGRATAAPLSTCTSANPLPTERQADNEGKYVERCTWRHAERYAKRLRDGRPGGHHGCGCGALVHCVSETAQQRQQDIVRRPLLRVVLEHRPLEVLHKIVLPVHVALLEEFVRDGHPLLRQTTMCLPVLEEPAPNDLPVWLNFTVPGSVFGIWPVASPRCFS